MRKLFFVLLGAIVLQSCDSDKPDVGIYKMCPPIGPWEVVKERMTNGDGFGGVVTRTENFHWSIDSYYFDSVNSQVYIWNSQACYLAVLEPFPYTVEEQNDGTLLLTIPGMYDQQPNLDGGLSPITIHKQSQYSMEWEFESYGGDEGPVVYYQYLQSLYEGAD